MLSAMSLASANEVITFNHSRQRLWTIYIGVTLCTTRGTQAPVWVPSDATSLPGRSGARTRESGASGGARSAALAARATDVSAPPPQPNEKCDRGEPHDRSGDCENDGARRRVRQTC
jgi:hypothetical protein